MRTMDHLDPVSTWRSRVKRYFHDDLKPPFNIAARNATHFLAAFYGPLALRDDLVTSSKKGQTPSVDCQHARQD